MPKYKIRPTLREEIYNWKDMKGQPLPDDPSKRISAYTVAEMYNISHTMVYRIWKEGKVVYDLDTEILKRFLLPFYQQEIEIDFDNVMIPRVQQLVKEVIRDA